MNVRVLLFVITQCFLVALGQYRDVEIDQGTVRGYRHATRDIYTFHGIPYATAPTGRDKFKAPLPAPKWDGIFNAVEEFVVCPQAGFIDFNEDCLVSNVFVPGGDDADVLKPVLVVLHGGGFLGGYGNQWLPYNIAEKGIVGVTFNYRLHAHGFLCLNTQNVPGNAGLKDQRAALQWIKDNIRAFGGNPDDVTVYGFSAGAAAAELLMLSPMVGDLLHKVILDSGSALATWIVNPTGVEFARNIAIRNGALNVDTITQLESYYLNLSYSELFSLQPTRLPGLTFSPCVEDISVDEEWVINTLPQNIIESGNYTKIPLLTGYTDAESLVFYGGWNAIMSEMNENFVNQLPPNFEHYFAMNKEEAANLLRKFYFDEEIIGQDSLRNFSDYLTDSYFAYSIIDSARLHSYNSGQVYLYEFTYITSYQVIGPEIGSDHCTQTYLVLNEGLLSTGTIFDENDLIVQQRLVDMWTNFIKFGRPVLPEENISWESLDADRMNYLRIDFNVQNENFPLQQRIQLWENISKQQSAPDSGHLVYSQAWLIFFVWIIFANQ